MLNHKIIAIFGNHASGKTTLATQLALYLKKQNPDKNVLIIGLDNTTPSIPLLFPNDTTSSNISLGKTLSKIVLDQSALLENIKLSSDKVAVLGYNMNENANTYAAPTQERYDDFYLQARHMVDICIIDCTSDIRYSTATARAIANADFTIELLTAGVNGIVWDASQTSLLLHQDYNFNNFLRYITIKDSFNYDIEALKNCHGKIFGVINNHENLNVLLQNGELIKTLHKPYIHDLKDIISKIKEQDND